MRVPRTWEPGINHGHLNRLRISAAAFGLVALSCVPFIPICQSSPTSQGPLTRPDLAQSKDTKMGAIATKVREFNEDLPVGGLAFSRDGTRLAVNPTFAGSDVHVWDWTNGKRTNLVFHNVASPGDGSELQFSVDGLLLAVGHQRSSKENGFSVIRIWDAQRAIAERDIAEPSGGDNKSIAFTPDGALFIRTTNVSGNVGDDFVVHRVATWNVEWSLRLFPLLPRSLALSPDSRFAAIGGEVRLRGSPVKIRPQIVIVDLSARRVVRTIDGAFPDHNVILTLAWSPDGALLAAGGIVQGSYPGPDGVKIFDPSNGKQIASEPIAGAAYVSGLAFTPDGRYLVEAYLEGHVRIWDGHHGKLLQTIPLDDHFHPAIGITRDSHHIAIASGKAISIWQLN